MSVKEGLETEGVSVPTFSGHAQDFAKFKRDFEALVVPDRDTTWPLKIIEVFSKYFRKGRWRS